MVAKFPELQKLKKSFETAKKTFEKEVKKSGKAEIAAGLKSRQNTRSEIR